MTIRIISQDRFGNAIIDSTKGWVGVINSKGMWINRKQTKKYLEKRGHKCIKEDKKGLIVMVKG